MGRARLSGSAGQHLGRTQLNAVSTVAALRRVRQGRERSDIGSDIRQNRAAERLGVIAVQLVEAARFAWDGDRDGAKARICRALTLLGTGLGSGEAAPRREAKPHTGEGPHGMVRGGLAPFQARRLAEYIDTHLAERIVLRQLARMAGLSTGHFSRAFKQTFGIPTHTYLIRRRIEIAQSLMLSTELPLSEIALTCGLSDQSHFTRMFRRIVGETPYAWRRVRRDALGTLRAETTGAPLPTAEGARAQAGSLTVAK
jgi:AraC family transcriptional regulator